MPTDPSRAPRVRALPALLLAVGTATGSFVLAVLSGLLVPLGAGATTALLVRTVLVTVLLLVAVRACLARVPSAARTPTALAGLLGGFVLGLGWIEGTTYAGRLVTDEALPAAVLDLVLWVAVGLLALRLVPPAPEERRGYL